MAVGAITGCGGGAFSSGSGDPASVKPADSQAITDDGGAAEPEAAAPRQLAGDSGAIAERDAKPSNVSDASTPSACVRAFDSLEPSCVMVAVYTATRTQSADLCKIAHADARGLCSGISDSAVTGVCLGSTCFTTAAQCADSCRSTDPICVYECYGYPICGASEGSAIAQCVSTMAPGSPPGPLACILEMSCYPSYDPGGW